MLSSEQVSLSFFHNICFSSYACDKTPQNLSSMINSTTLNAINTSSHLSYQKITARREQDGCLLRHISWMFSVIMFRTYFHLSICPLIQNLISQSALAMIFLYPIFSVIFLVYLSLSFCKMTFIFLVLPPSSQVSGQLENTDCDTFRGSLQCCSPILAKIVKPTFYHVSKDVWCVNISETVPASSEIVNVLRCSVTEARLL